MSLRYVFFRDNSSSHKEVYLTRLPKGGFDCVAEPSLTNLVFDTAAEAYEFAKPHPTLQSWHVGRR